MGEADLFLVILGGEVEPGEVELSDPLDGVAQPGPDGVDSPNGLRSRPTPPRWPRRCGFTPPVWPMSAARGSRAVLGSGQILAATAVLVLGYSASAVVSHHDPSWNVLPNAITHR